MYRNEYEHFIPKIYLAPIYDLLYVSNVCIDISKKLIFESGNITIYENERQKKIEDLLQKIKLKIDENIKK
ncbi:MAG: hypothetical protein DRI57_10390 [Deltaproteobacteria bacterium]|nr:MAG: hypothetical protein DRI57_10390 [Deltaproteobacteria bacterium]